MDIRTITRNEIADLLQVIRSVGPHGHREWPTDEESDLLATLDNPRLDPDAGNWAIAYVQGIPVGYVLVEPELNIGRMLLGLAANPQHPDILKTLLNYGIENARSSTDITQFELHAAVRDSEPQHISQTLIAAKFNPLREILKMRVPGPDLKLRGATIPKGWRLRPADMSDIAEGTAVTNLHNACFSDSWGFSPNTVDEITRRASTDAERNGFPPILVIENQVDNSFSAYIWTTLNDDDGRIEMVGVSPEMRGTGLGRTTVNAGIRHLIRNGAETLSLDVDAHNPSARHIYESAGYQTYSRVKYYSLQVLSEL